MGEQSLNSEMEKLVQELKHGGLAFRRLEAVEKIGKLRTSHPQLVLALLRAGGKDDSEEVRNAAAEALKIPVHAEVLQAHPELTELARQDEVIVLKQSVFGLISFGLSILSIVIIYIDIFLLSGQGVDAAAPVLDISPFFCLSFLLSLVGVVFGIIGIRQEGRVKVFSRLGLLGNAIIIVGSLILTMVVNFKVT